MYAQKQDEKDCNERYCCLNHVYPPKGLILLKHFLNHSVNFLMNIYKIIKGAVFSGLPFVYPVT